MTNRGMETIIHQQRHFKQWLMQIKLSTCTARQYHWIAFLNKIYYKKLQLHQRIGECFCQISTLFHSLPISNSSVVLKSMVCMTF